MTDGWTNPATWLAQFQLPAPVVSCAEAAAAKGVALTRELKSLLLHTDVGFVLAHVAGDQRLSLRAVKRQLATRQAVLATTAELEMLGVAPGTITPFSANLWPLPQLISTEVLELSWVTTNAGRLDRFVVFDPAILLRATTATATRLAEPGVGPSPQRTSP